jgi:thiol-disulfide isomerase/thioredoxin
MSLSRRHGLYALAGVAALAAGAGLQWRRLSPSEPAAAALEDFWRQEFDTPTGARLPVRSLRGRPLVLNFWATWCPPCVKEMPELDRFAQSAGVRGWQVLGVAIDQAEAVRSFLQATPVGFPVAVAGVDGLGLVRQLGNAAGALPFTVVLAADGRILQRKMGATTLDELETWSRQA